MRPQNIYAVASGKGGTGKTTVTAGLASALSLLGKRVVAVDCDIGLHNLDLALGLQDSCIFDFGDVLAGRCPLEKALLTHPDMPNLSFLPSATDSAELSDADVFCSLMRDLSGRFDFCFIDAPAGIGSVFRLIASAADRALIVSTPDTPCLMDSSVAAELLYGAGVRDVRLVLNRVLPSLIRRRSAWNIDESMDRLGLRLAGVIFDDREITACFNRCEPVMLSHARRAKAGFSETAERLLGIPKAPRL